MEHKLIETKASKKEEKAAAQITNDKESNKIGPNSNNTKIENTTNFEIKRQTSKEELKLFIPKKIVIDIFNSFH